MKKLAVVLISAMTAFTGVIPAQAFPLANAPIASTPVAEKVGNVEQVQYRRHWNHGGRHWNRGGRHWDRGRHWSGNRRYYRDHGWRRHHGWNGGAVIGGLAAGAIIGGALAQPRYAPRAYGGNDHQRWCYARYRSYRASDNTYQPNYGPRRQCVVR